MLLEIGIYLVSKNIPIKALQCAWNFKAVLKKIEGRAQCSENVKFRVPSIRFVSKK